MQMTKEALAGLSKPRILEFEAGGLKGYVRSVATKDFLAVRRLPEGAQDVRLVLLSLCDAAGNRLLVDGDGALVEGLPIDFTNEAIKAVMRVNGLSTEGFGDAGKNSTTP